MRQFFLGTFIWGLLSNSLMAQSIMADSDSIISKQSRWALRLPLTSYFEKYNSINIGFFKENNSSFDWGFELGYIAGLNQYYSIGFDSEKNEGLQNPLGAKLLFQLRIKLDDVDLVDMEGDELYIDFEPYLYYVNYDISLIAGYECNDQQNNCTYYRLYDTNTNRFTSGFFMNLGKKINFDRMFIEVYSGIGLRYTLNQDGLPEDPVIDNLYNRSGGQSRIPEGFSLKGKLGFVLGYKL